MISIVLDTNSLIVSVPKRSEFRPIFDALINGHFQLLISTEILNEYAEKLEEKMSAVVSFNVVEMITQLDHAIKTDIYYKWHLINQDVDDNKFVDCAIAGNAQFIVTDDKHYRVLKNIDFPSVKVIQTAAFRDIVVEGKLL
jgi:putative PIN family toxin of toxin-antitoxin system